MNHFRALCSPRPSRQSESEARSYVSPILGRTDTPRLKKPKRGTVVETMACHGVRRIVPPVSGGRVAARPGGPRPRQSARRTPCQCGNSKSRTRRGHPEQCRAAASQRLLPLTSGSPRSSVPGRLYRLLSPGGSSPLRLTGKSCRGHLAGRPTATHLAPALPASRATASRQIGPRPSGVSASLADCGQPADLAAAIRRPEPMIGPRRGQPVGRARRSHPAVHAPCGHPVSPSVPRPPGGSSRGHPGSGSRRGHLVLCVL